MPKLTIDGRQIEVPRGTRVIEAAKKLGVKVPHYCYHAGLSIAGNCRMCLVEIEKSPKLQIACHIEAADGMVVKTQTDAVLQARQDILEFLLLNHPLDCPVCDQAGECKLQDYYMQHGLYDPKFDEDKIRKSKKAFSIGPTVMLDTERCILCSRCVRFTAEITKTHEFGIFNRGDHAEIGLVPGKELDNKYSGNVVDICPVGALTDKDFRFKCRVWYLGSVDSICTGCSRGCNIEIHFDRMRPHKQAGQERVMRFKPRTNPQVNQWWMCDAGRYSYKAIDQNRLLQVTKRTDGIPQAASWEEALQALASMLRKTKDAKSQGRVGVIASPDMTNEELFLLRELFRDELGIRQIDYSLPELPGDSDDFLITADKHPNRAGCREILGDRSPLSADQMVEQAEKGAMDLLIVFGYDLVELVGAERVGRAAQQCKMVYIATHRNAMVQAAHWALPAASFAEIDGTFTNVLGRVQRIRMAVPSLGESRPTRQILMDIADRLGVKYPYQSAQDIFQRMENLIPAFVDMSYEKIGTQGMEMRKT